MKSERKTYLALLGGKTPAGAKVAKEFACQAPILPRSFTFQATRSVKRQVPRDSKLPILSVVECDTSGAFFRNIGKTPWQSSDDRQCLLQAVRSGWYHVAVVRTSTVPLGLASYLLSFMSFLRPSFRGPQQWPAVHVDKFLSVMANLRESSVYRLLDLLYSVFDA